MKQAVIGLLIASAAMAAPADSCPCNDGNYLKVVSTTDRTQDKCEPNPTDSTKIGNCKNYSHNGSTLSCAGCDSGFYLKTSSSCVANPASGAAGYDAQCESYGADGKCAYCKDGHYLHTDKSCKTPTSTITDCKKYSTATTCGTCNSGKILDATAFDCKAAVPTTGAVADCQAYTVTGGTYTCAYCKEGKYLDTTCKTDITAVTDCKFYTSKTQCMTCKDGKHLDGNACKACPSKGKSNNSSSTVLTMSAVVLALLLLIA